MPQETKVFTITAGRDCWGLDYIIENLVEMRKLGNKQVLIMLSPIEGENNRQKVNFIYHIDEPRVEGLVEHVTGTYTKTY
jgi:hypothetical protein